MTALNPKLDPSAHLPWYSFVNPSDRLTPLPLPRTDYFNRYNTTMADRMVHVAELSMLLGGLMGVWRGGQKISLIFRAENAHRQPKTRRGWYNYHKYKNVYVLDGALNAGFFYGLKVTGGAMMFTVAEDAVDRLRGRQDALSTAAAGLGCAGIFSVWMRLGRGLTLSAAKRGLGLGLIVGMCQDLQKGMRGHGSGIFEWFGWDGKEVLVDEPEYWIQKYLMECEEDQKKWRDPNYRRGLRERMLSIEAALEEQQKKAEEDKQKLRGLVGLARWKWNQWREAGKDGEKLAEEATATAAPESTTA